MRIYGGTPNTSVTSLPIKSGVTSLPIKRNRSDIHISRNYPRATPCNFCFFTGSCQAVDWLILVYSYTVKLEAVVLVANCFPE